MPTIKTVADRYHSGPPTETVSSSKNASTTLSQNPPTVSEIHDTPIQATTVLAVLKAE